jgi:teichoic acid transport system permease protein
MKKVIMILWEQLINLPLILRMIRFGDQSTYQNHYLGLAWKIINPILQMCVYFVLFGLGLRGARELGTHNTGAFAIWLIGGMALWFYLQQGITQGSSSIKSQVGLLSKMKFPLSTLPTIAMLSNIWTFIVLFSIALIAATYYNYPLQFNIVGLIYVVVATHLFVYSSALLLSTLVLLVPDISALVNFTMRINLFMSGVIISLDNLDNAVGSILRLNPIYYLIKSFRMSYFEAHTFQEILFQPYTLIFWSVTILLLLSGAHLHNKFKQNFVEYI